MENISKEMNTERQDGNYEKEIKRQKGHIDKICHISNWKSRKKNGENGEEPIFNIIARNIV